MSREIAKPVRAVPRAELEIMGQRIIEDAKGDEIAYVPFDEDAEEIASAVNHYADLLALRDAVGLLLDPKHFRTEGDRARLVAAYEKVKP